MVDDATFVLPAQRVSNERTSQEIGPSCGSRRASSFYLRRIESGGVTVCRRACHGGCQLRRLGLPVRHRKACKNSLATCLGSSVRHLGPVHEPRFRRPPHKAAYLRSFTRGVPRPCAHTLVPFAMPAATLLHTPRQE